MRVVRTVLEADLTRLKVAREQADGRYNEALTALDAAIAGFPPPPPPPPRDGAAAVAPLRASADVLSALSRQEDGWRGRLRALVLRVVAPAFERQQAFNAAVVELASRRAAQEDALAASVEAVCGHVAQLARAHHALILLLQEVTPYVDTKDYEWRGLATRITEDVAEAHARLAEAVDGIASRLEELTSRVARTEGAGESLAALQLAVQALKREAAGRPAHAAPAPAASVEPVAAAGQGGVGALAGDPLSSHKYVAFENAFRGPREGIRDRQASYLALFEGRQDVLDIGCGRGEFLQLLAQRGIRARGLDLNHEMAEACRSDGLDVQELDALAHLRGLADDALGGLVALQVVEHLEPEYLVALLDEAFRVLRPGSPVVLETINVASWYAFFSSYIRDVTHVRPLHPETLKFFVAAAGFLDARIELRVPLPPGEQLALAPPDTRAAERDASGTATVALLALADTFDRNMARLNAHLYAPLDYAVIAWKRG